jgi:hypothetical protein
VKTLVAMIVCITVIAASIAVLVLNPFGSDSSSSTKTTVTTAAKGTVILTQSGTTPATTTTFTVGSKWQLVWRFDCTGTRFGTGEFAVRIFNAKTAQHSADFVNRDVHSSGPSGAGIEHYTVGDSAQKVLTIQTACRWGIIVAAD